MLQHERNPRVAFTAFYAAATDGFVSMEHFFRRRSSPHSSHERTLFTHSCRAQLRPCVCPHPHNPFQLRILHPSPHPPANARPAQDRTRSPPTTNNPRKPLNSRGSKFQLFFRLLFIALSSGQCKGIDKAIQVNVRAYAISSQRAGPPPLGQASSPPRSRPGQAARRPDCSP